MLLAISANLVRLCALPRSSGRALLRNSCSAFEENSQITQLSAPPASPNDADAILIFGGDGTIHRNLARLVELKLPVLVVPCGSGNDFARALGLRKRKDSLEAWRQFLIDQSNVHAIDVGVIAPQNAPDSTRYFCNVGGVGLDSEIAKRANRLPRWLLGKGGYALSLIPALLKYSLMPMKITTAEWTTGDKYEPIFFSAFANAPAYGGGMRIAPRARMDDGKLDVCVVHRVSKFKLLCLFPTVYFGRHLSVREVAYFQTQSLALETETPADVYADGEFVCQTPVKVTVAPRALRVIIGGNHETL